MLLFSAGYYFSQVYPFKLFPLEISLGGRIFLFSEISHNSLKSQLVGPKNPLNIFFSVDRF